MRINIYSQELTPEVRLISKTANTGIIYHAVQIMLHSSPLLHHTQDDDDRSAVSFWLPRSSDRREIMACAFEEMARLLRTTFSDEE
jgi:hypothetical protein